MIGAADGTIYDNSVQLMANVVDYALEDETLLGIRARGSFNRTLPPLAEREQMAIEVLNYGLALAGIVLVFLAHRWRVGVARRKHDAWLAGETA